MLDIHKRQLFVGGRFCINPNFLSSVVHRTWIQKNGSCSFCFYFIAFNFILGKSFQSEKLKEVVLKLFVIISYEVSRSGVLVQERSSSFSASVASGGRVEASAAFQPRVAGEEKLRKRKKTRESPFFQSVVSLEKHRVELKPVK